MGRIVRISYTGGHCTMNSHQSILFEDSQIEVNKEGYLVNLDDWSKELAQYMATLEPLELTEQHWEVIYFVRNFYEEYDTSPAIRALVNAMQKKYGKETFTSRYLYRLFPNGPAKIACKLAGLPKPAKCL